VPIADELKARITAAMAMLGGGHPVTLRIITETGGDPLLGIRGTPTVVDTLVSPTPWSVNVSYAEIQASGGKLKLGDMKFLFPPGMTQAQLEGSLIVTDGLEYEPIQIDGWGPEGQDVWWAVTARRKISVGQQE